MRKSASQKGFSGLPDTTEAKEASIEEGKVSGVRKSSSIY